MWMRFDSWHHKHQMYIVCDRSIDVIAIQNARWKIQCETNCAECVRQQQRDRECEREMLWPATSKRKQSKIAFLYQWTTTRINWNGWSSHFHRCDFAIWYAPSPSPSLSRSALNSLGPIDGIGFCNLLFCFAWSMGLAMTKGCDTTVSVKCATQTRILFFNI